MRLLIETHGDVCRLKLKSQPMICRSLFISFPIFGGGTCKCFSGGPDSLPVIACHLGRGFLAGCEGALLPCCAPLLHRRCMEDQVISKDPTSTDCMPKMPLLWSLTLSAPQIAFKQLEIFLIQLGIFSFLWPYVLPYFQ